MIEWKEEYCVGVKMIDTQHKELIRIAEKAQELLYLPTHTDKYDEIVSIINELRDYTKYHFECEENLMKAISYSKLFSHKVEHQDFIDEIYEVDLAQMDEDQDKHLLSIVEFIAKWILEHIQRRDTVLAEEYQLKKSAIKG